MTPKTHLSLINQCSVHTEKMSYKPPSNFQQSKESAPKEDLENGEMLLIRVPKKFDISRLHGVEYVPGEIQDIVVDANLPGQMTATYQLGAFEGGQDLNMAPLVKRKKYRENVVGQPVSGFLSVTKSFTIDSKPSPYTLPSLHKYGRPSVAMPEGLRERFTPFGSGTPTHIPKIIPQVKKGKRSRESTASSDESPHKEKKRRKKEGSSGVVNNGIVSSDDVTDPELDLRLGRPSSAPQDSGDEQNATHSHKKNKKDKRYRGGDATVNQLSNLSSPLASGESRSKKKKRVSFAQEDSICMDSSKDTSNLSSLRLKSDTLAVGNSSSKVNGDASESTKLDKGRQSCSGYSTADTSMDITFSPPADRNTHKKKKKKKHKHKDEDS